jgi:serine/threonine-protein kinase
MNCSICNAPATSNATICLVCGSPLQAEMHSSAEQDALPRGTQLNKRYTIDKVLGRGGFGITYLAHDREQRALAIKEFLPFGWHRPDGKIVHVDAEAAKTFEADRRMFVGEFHLLEKFLRPNHPNIVDVEKIFQENGTSYIVMEYLPGKTLARHVEQQGALSAVEAIFYITEVAYALETMHDLGVLHRDIKPENVMLCDNGRVVLIDFGSGYTLPLSSNLTLPASLSRNKPNANSNVLITPGYAPLEQYHEATRLHRYTDIYALAALLYYLVTGQAPVAATKRAQGIKLRQARDVNQRVSSQMSQDLEWAMQMEVARRPQNLREWLFSLHHNYWRFVSSQNAKARTPRFDVIREKDATWYAVPIENPLTEIRWPQECANCGKAGTLEGLPLAPQLPPVPYCSACGFAEHHVLKEHFNALKGNAREAVTREPHRMGCGSISTILGLWYFYGNVYTPTTSLLTDINELTRLLSVATMSFFIGYIFSSNKPSSTTATNDAPKIRVRRPDTISVRWNSAHPKQLIFKSRDYAVAFHQINSTKR